MSTATQAPVASRDASSTRVDATALDATPLDAIAGRLALAAGAVAGRPLVLEVAAPGVPGNRPVRAEYGSDGRVVLVALVQDALVVGPSWAAGHREDTRPGPCPDCLLNRWVEARPRLERDLLEQARGVVQVAPAPLLTGFVLDIAAELVAASAAGSGPFAGGGAGLGHLVRVNVRTGALDRYRLMTDSTCRRCSAPPADGVDDAAGWLDSGAKRAVDDYRLRSAGELDLPLDALVNPVCGVLGTTALRAYQCTANAPVTGFFLARSKYALHEMWWSGHGDDYATSEVLGVLEGLERHAGQRPRARKVARVAPADALDVPYLPADACGAYTPEFYAGHHDNYAPWSDDVPIRWVWGWSLRDQRAVLVPEQLAYYLDRHDDTRNAVQECSNGCASGSAMAEAILHGMLELVERDAFLVTWYAGISPPAIDLASVTSPRTRAMIERVELLGYDMRCFDIRVDLPVPVVAGLAVRRDGGPGQLCFAAGASLDPEDAVRAAVCEVASYVPGFDERVADAMPEVGPMARDFRRLTELQHHALLYGLPEMRRHAEFFLRGAEPRPIDELYAGWERQRPRTSDLGDDVRCLTGLIAGTGSDVVVVDQTSPEQSALGLHACATIAPGLVPIDFGWERQRALRLPRVRTAPAAAGLLPAPLREDQLNRVPHPFP